MSVPLPPLNALRAFEAAARHLSFKKAAEELHVTPAAVGHQVKALEDFLGVQLFRRLNRAVMLTDAGQTCLPELREGFGKLASAVERLRARDGRGLLIASVAPTFAVKWLVPRLDRFQAAHPEITVRIETTMAVVDLVRDGIDVAIRFCPDVERGLRGEILFGEEVIPVCSPRLMDGPQPLRRSDDLRHQTLIHLEGETADRSWPDWQTWLSAAGVPDADQIHGLRFTQSIAAAQAAMDGQGIALIGRTCFLDDLAARRLVRPFDLGFPTEYAYRVVSPETMFDQPKVVAFREWLRSEAVASLCDVEDGGL
jgi:LysR family glycine cleavage system transcriptional activator